MMIKILVTASLIIFANVWISAQTFSVYGTVTDKEGLPLPGVNVIVAGLATGDASSENGEYRIKGLAKGEYIIEFSIIGFRSERKRILLLSDTKLNSILEEEAITTEQVIVSAGKHEQKLSDLPVSASMIDNRDLLRYNFNNLRDALKYVSGVNMVDDQLSIRGSSGYSRGVGARVLLAIDGIPFYTGDTGEIIWEAVPVNEIERVEIIKGASSSLYGSTAIGGVVNLITKEADQPFTYVKSFIGFYDKPSHEIWDWSGEYRLFNGQTISHSNRFGNFGFAASFTRLEDPGYKKNNFNKRYIGYLKAAYEISDASSLKILFNSLNQRSGNFIYWKDSRNALVPPDADLGQSVGSDRYIIGIISDNKLTDNLNLIFRGSYYTTEWSDETASRNSSSADQFRGEVQSNYRIGSLLLVNGFELNSSRVNSNLFGSPESFGAGIYSQGEYLFSFPLSLTAGIRYDYNKVNDQANSSALSPRLGLNYKLNSNLSARGMIGTGFRAPSLAEKFTSTFVSGIGIRPNPGVSPESNVTLEAGILFHPENLIIDAAVFRNEYFDMIEPALDPADGEVTFKNLVRARIEGFELNVSPPVADFLKINFSYTYLYPRDIHLNKILKYRPRHIFNSSVSYSDNGIESGFDFRYWSKVEEIDFELIDLGFVPDGDKRVAVYVLDFNAGYNFLHIGFPGRMYLNVKNMLNYNYIELIGNIAPLRNIAISFELFL